MQEVSVDVQALSHDLQTSKLEYLGVVAGIKAWSKEFAERQKVEIDFSPDDIHRPTTRRRSFSVSSPTGGPAQRCQIQQRNQVKVELPEISNEIQLIVSDAGTGFDVESALCGKGLGLHQFERTCSFGKRNNFH
jgi:signal transduction histidine kinase